MSPAVVFAAAFAVLYAGHTLGDMWVQRNSHAIRKGDRTRAGMQACTIHVATLTATQALMWLITAPALGIPVHPGWLALGLGINAATHYWADRRHTLAALARRIGKGEFYALGTPRAGYDDNPCLGTGAFHLDQAWHIGFLWVAALIIAL